MSPAPGRCDTPASRRGDGSTSPVPATAEEQAGALAEYIGRAFPGWTIWQAHRIWYATGPCPQPGCGCSRTLHAPSPSDLCRRLDDTGRRARQEVPR
ncbi:hypothetical protein GCM10010517_08280 [Streptosporangium fragile]|uniref:Uncharacterized protein n=1 Tax=Streptosporangium fragile TaxID=46186 RepID=A0ABP6I924_9ACTN